MRITKLTTCLKISLIVLAALCTAAAGKTIYVDDSATGLNNGTSWINAYNHLQDALTDAIGGDEIRVAQGIYKPDEGYGFTPGDIGATFQLKNGVTIKGGYAGFGVPDLDVRSITSHKTILSGERDPMWRNYHVVTGSGTDSTAVLDGFTITAGDTYGAALTGGGGMLNVSGSPTVVNCTFTGNSGNNGGGMYNVSSSPLLTNCTFSGNTTARGMDYDLWTGGSGMYNEQNSNPTLNDCTFTGNTAKRGGGMYNRNSAPRLTNCTFSGNEAVEEETFTSSEVGKGGGMYNWESSPLLTNCTFNANTAMGNMYSNLLSGGGGMYNDQNSNPTLTDCTFSGNTAELGGGMGNRQNSNPTLTNCTFSGNTAKGMDYDPWGGGGGMCNELNSNPTLTDCKFTGNSARDGGGMYDWKSIPTLTNCTFSGNTAEGRGGGIYNSQSSWTNIRGVVSSPTLTDCTFSGNTAEWDGGGMYNSRSSPTLTNCTFIGNTAKSGGGGMHNRESSPTLTNCTFSGNTAERGNGGGGMHNYRSSPTLTNCTFNDNSGNSGGGMYNDNNSNPTLTDCTFNANTAKGRGGGMYNYESSPTLTTCIFNDNSANSGGGMYTGGGMYNVTAILTLTDCTFSENTAERDGGGMYNVVTDSLILANCTFSGNTAEWDGGGMYNDGIVSLRITITNCTFGGNTAESGGGVYNRSDVELSRGTYYRSMAEVINCTFSSNSAATGGGIRNYSGSVTLTNCILSGGGDDVWNNQDASMIINYSDIQASIYDPGSVVIWGEGNIDADPLFADPGYWADVNDPNIVVDPNDPNAVWINGDYHLKSQAGRWDPVSESWFTDDITSPCIDAGDPNSDFSGETWPHGERINMGAYGGMHEASMSLETEGMTLPRVAYIFSRKSEVAESFQSLLGAYGCSTTLISLDDVPATPLDSCDLIIVANDTQHEDTWNDPNTVAAIEDSNKPVIGLGEGGYTFFGKLELSIGYPNGAHGDQNSIEVIDPNSSLFSFPYSIEIPEDRALQLYTETEHVGLYLWPTIPETVTALAGDANNFPYYLLATEYNRYLLWGFTESPQKMTEIGKTLFINVFIRTVNKVWESKI